MDSIIDNMTTGVGRHNLHKLKDEKYLSCLESQTDLWAQLKRKIRAFREGTYSADELVTMSETYFIMANHTVQAAERYSEEKASALQKIQVALVAVISLVVVFLGYKTFAAVRLRRRNLLLNDMAYMDTNTGLPNKGMCEKMLLEKGILEKDRTYACLMFDLNNLKAVNDTLGHKAGDALIHGFAGILRKTLPEEVFLGRYGGDEFIAVAEGVSEVQIRLLLDQIEKNISKYRDSKYGITISYAVGYEMSTGYQDCNLRILLDQADKNMYADKMRKKGRK